jgi:hypothetical protein
VTADRDRTSRKGLAGMEPDDHLTLTEEQLDRLADRVAIRLAATKQQAKPMLTVEDICEMLKVSRAWVYENAGRLGGFKLGPSDRAPLRFEAARVAKALTPLVSPDTPEAETATKTRRRSYLHPVYDG